MSPVPPLVDTHAHLEELPDLPAALGRAREAGVTAIVAVGSAPDSNRRVLELAAAHRGLVYAALGLHPGLLTDAMPLDDHIRIMEDSLPAAVAIGEVGLDYHKRVLAAAGKELQHRAFSAVLALARRSRKPAIVHSRYAWRDSFTLTAGAGVDRAVFHWYTGPTNVLGEILDRGYFISATPAVEYHAEHRRAVKEAPLGGLLLETDCPVVYQGHRSEPADVARVLRTVADIKGLPPETVAEQTTDNAQRLFGFQ